MITLASLKKRLKLPHAPGGMNPARDWLVVLALSLLLIVGSVAWNVSFFVRALNDEAASLQAGDTLVPAASVLPALRSTFEARAQEAARYESAVFVDPSR